MKKRPPFTLAIPLVLLVSALALGAAPKKKGTKKAAPAQPAKNVILILADDLGWADTTLYGKSKLYETPNLERLAARGVTFNRAYSMPLCSPTRASILTGQCATRHGITSPGAHTNMVRLKPEMGTKAAPGDKATVAQAVTRLDTALPTLGKLMKKAGYATAHFGKWHLGKEPYSPLEHGFDVDVPHWPGPGPAGSYVAPWQFPGITHLAPGEHIEDRMANEAVAWLKKQRADRPFFMNYWQFSVHAPFDAKADLIARYTKKIAAAGGGDDGQNSPTYAAMVHSLDDAVGRLLDALDEAKVADNTIIIFYSDNGGNGHSGILETDADGKEYVARPTSNRPLKGGKGSMYEGGVRVPAIVAWPGVSKPGTRSDVPISCSDLYPTILRMAGADWPASHPVDGIDVRDAVRGKSMGRGPIFTYFPHRTRVPGWLPPSTSVHDGDWKLLRLFHQGEDGAHDYQLYNLKDDVGETKNLAKTYPEKVQAMDRLIENHLDKTGALRPLRNERFDPEQYDPSIIGKQIGGVKMSVRPHTQAKRKPKKPGPAKKSPASKAGEKTSKTSTFLANYLKKNAAADANKDGVLTGSEFKKHKAASAK